MQCSLDELRQKEVIDVRTGEKLGYIDDVVLDVDRRTLHGFRIFGRRRLFGLLGREEDIFVPCDGVQLYGKDVLLVQIETMGSSECTKNPAFNIKNFFDRT